MNTSRAFTIASTTLALGGVWFLVGCASHITPYKPKQRTFDSGEYAAKPPRATSSIYAQGGRGLMEDDRASRVGDLVVIQIDESDYAAQDSTTKIGSKNENAVGFNGGVVAALQKAVPSVELEKLFGSKSEFNFDGNGKVQRQGRISATLPVRVKHVLPNDDLYVEGTKVVMVGNEERHLYISGIIRPVDIRNDGTVSSARVADAEIEYTGRGDVSDQQRPGWFSRVFSKVWPF